MNHQDEEPVQHRFTQAQLEEIGEYLPDVRKALVGQRIERTYVAIALGVGLVAQVIGYVLKLNSTGEPFGLVVDLLYAFGFSLWTGAVVAFFVDILPDAKRRQLIDALHAYEAAQRERVRGPGEQPPI